MELAPTGDGIDLAVVLRFVDIATDALADAREEIDALNVYPVPDGDTGTNMYLTVSAARDAIAEAVALVAADSPGAALDDSARDAALGAFARGALLGARGNSGVILSEMLGALARRIGAAAAQESSAHTMAEALRDATDASYRAVGTPVEGTILTVARAASDAALARCAEPEARARDVFTAAAAAAREALARTPEQLEVLRHAGVVDAGGRGLSVILDAAETALTGRRPLAVHSPLGHRSIPLPLPRPAATETGDLSPDGPAYEVMYLLEADDDRVSALRARLAPLGDSLVVVGGERLWNVHIHVDDVGAAIEAGIEAGRPYRVRVTHFAEQVASHAASSAAPGNQLETPRTGRRVVAVAAGPGLTELFEAAGAIVVQGGPGRRPSTGQILGAITDSGAEEVVVLPNDGDSVRVAQIAAGTAETDLGLRVAVIPTQAQVQGLAALSVHEPGRGFDSDVLEMTATARHARHGAVTIAARQAMTMAGPCEPGDVLGVIAGDFAVVGADLHDVATDVVERMLGGGGDMVTLVGGADSGDLAQRAAAWVDAHHPHIDVVVYDGGQQRYPLLLSVE
ncbi:DAK2 domain-containing protein [Nocardioides sp.]|jgi:DAK2 domain fusion protein YloV|uniref:DAK2 domain-containing protein n=1 Tax=Nocardioides sp. TaxID=35761 RepID=UPI00261678DE|nr:DAK2 domain-containing protein [Nocardioides sp.]